MRKVMLITGGSRGIGAEVVRRSARDGFDVAFTYRTDEAAADALAGEVRGLGGRALRLRADTGEEADIIAAFTALDDAFGAPDAVVLNAGITGRFCRVDELDAATLQRVLAVNVAGVVLCAREAVKRMSTRYGGRGGSIVAISSRAATLGSPGEYVHYAASKAAVETFVRGLGKEVAAEGIRVNAVSPGVIDTEIHARGGDPGRTARVAPLIPLQRIGTAGEVANAVAWLAGDESAYTTAAVLEVGGGR